MEYLQGLTDHLTKRIVGKHKLNAWAEDGEIIVGTSGSDGFEIKYTSKFEMSDVSINPINLFLVLNDWLKKSDPDREGKGLPHPLFFTERLDNGSYDLGVKIEFVEQYDFVEDANGQWKSNGVVGTFKSDIEKVIDVDGLMNLEIVDSNTQDNKLQN